ncbi:putative obstructor B2-like [Homarus americanus]|uniref:Putative obstructor B2-like n=1 Tax=Homarus americanus TaxID=6706 RepID=A0A8J5TJW1_HOMAM|nr:putative obstructor B2-like [Homarus americanus]
MDIMPHSRHNNPSNYYVEYFDNYFKTLETTNGHVSADILAAAITSGYDVPQLKKRIDLSSGTGARRPSKARGSTPAPPRAPAAPTRPPVSQPRPPVSPTRHRFGTQSKPTATAPPPPPTPIEEAAYDYPADYTDPAYYDYPAEAAEPAAPPSTTTPAPAQAPRLPVIRRRVPLRNLRPTQ